MNTTTHRGLLTALAVCTCGPAALAQPTRLQEMDAAIAELKAAQAEAPPDQRKILERQVTSLENAKKMQRLVEEANASNKARRPALAEEQKAFFTPVAPAKLPVWIPDTVTRAQVKDDQLQCPSGARVYTDAHSLECRIPAQVPVPHGLALWFYKSTGRLKAQRYYENGLLRWAISYHHTGGRDSEGRYDDVKPKQHRESGLHTGYAPDGTIVRQAEYTSGALHGWTRLWEDDGFPMAATRYENGSSVERREPTARKP